MKNPVGSARTEPNVNPWLPPPLKRYNFSIHPGVLIASLITPELKAKLLIGAVIGICVCICFFFILVFLAGLAANKAS
jgi:hypothetical protein